MSRQVQTIMFRRGVVRHLALPNVSPLRYDNYPVTLCGINTMKREYVDVEGDRNAFGYRLCTTCSKVRQLADLDLVLPEHDAVTTARAVAMDAPIRQVPALVFRVQGSTDTYTVTLPENAALAGLCNCMSGKTRPDTECKHQAAVRLWLEGRAA